MSLFSTPKKFSLVLILLCVLLLGFSVAIPILTGDEESGLLRTGLQDQERNIKDPAPTVFTVDCDGGSDVDGDGSSSRPWQSPDRARNAIRDMRPLQAGVRVVVSGDCYPRSAGGLVDFSRPVLELQGSKDSGSAATPITYVADERVGARFLAGMKLPASVWTAIGGSHILVANLTELGVDSSFFGSMRRGAGLGICASDRLELFFRGVPMTLARYPNVFPNGTFQWLRIASVSDPQASFATNTPRPLRWASELDPWIHGYWGYDWADSHLPVVSVARTGDGGSRINVQGPVLYGFNSTARFYGENLRSELDAPGEYYLDRNTGLLYFWPPEGGMDSGEAFVSVGEYAVTMGPLKAEGMRHSELHAGVARAAGGGAAWELPHPRRGRSGDAWGGFMAGREAELGAMREALARGGQGDVQPLAHVTLEGFTVAFARKHGVFAAGCLYSSLVKLHVHNVGQHGIWMDGYGLTAVDCVIADVGCSAVALSGGDFATLKPSGNVVRGCEMHRYARVTRTYVPAVAWFGVGHTVEGNHMHDAPHSGVLGDGNDCRFVGNLFERLGYEVSDSGAWYSSRSWTRRGHVISSNVFRDIRNTQGSTLGYLHVMAIYFDDMLSGCQIVNNTFEDVQIGILLGGSRDVLIANNRFTNVKEWAIIVDNRGPGFDQYLCAYNSSFVGRFAKEMLALRYYAPPYAEEYPMLAVTLDDHQCLPWHLNIVRNDYCLVGTAFLNPKPGAFLRWAGVVKDNVDVCGGVKQVAGHDLQQQHHHMASGAAKWLQGLLWGILGQF